MKQIETNMEKKAKVGAQNGHQNCRCMQAGQRVKQGARFNGKFDNKFG